MNQTQTPTRTPHNGIIQYHHAKRPALRERFSLAFVASTLLLLGTAATPISAQTLIYESDFSGDTIGERPSGWLQNSIVAEDPLDSEVKVMATLGGTTRSTYTRHSESSETTDVGGFALAFSIYIGDAGPNWNTNHYIQTGTLANASYFSNGYGFAIGSMNVTIQSTTGGGSSGNQGSSTVLVDGTVPDNTWLEDSWNDLLFTWKSNGELSISLNGTHLLDTVDTTHEPSYRTLRFNSFVNNNPDPAINGQQLFYDNITVSSIPESSSIALACALAALGFCFWHKRRRS